jgi:UDP-glucose 4-epimerase
VRVLRREAAISIILVTGSSGFLGSRIVDRLLSAGHTVLGIDPMGSARADFRHITDDLSDAARLRALIDVERPTHIIHSGGVSGAMVIPDQPVRIMAINVMGTMNLLQAALESSVRTFIYCSSISAHGDFFEEKPIDEDYPLRPNNPYGCSKGAIEMVLRGLWGRVRLDLCSLRFTGIYGPGRQTTFVIDEIVDAAIKKRIARLPAATGWPFIYIDDAVDAAIKACFSERRQQLTYFIAHPEQVTLDDLARAASVASTVTIEIDEKAPPSRRGPVDIGPAERDFGFVPKVDYREGIRRMIDMRQRGRG